MNKKISDLKPARYNPVSRTKSIGGLVASIEEVGLLYPILITSKNEVVDGHRRLAACKKLGWTDVPVLLAKGSLATMYQNVNITARHFSGNETLQVYLEEPEAVGVISRNALVELEQVVGRPLVKRMAKEGFSLSTWKICKRIAHSADQTDQDVLIALLKWMMHFGCMGLAKRAIQQGTPAGLLIAAAKKMKPIKVKYQEA